MSPKKPKTTRPLTMTPETENNGVAVPYDAQKHYPHDVWVAASTSCPEFLGNLRRNQQNLDPDFIKLVDDNFWDLVGFGGSEGK